MFAFESIMLRLTDVLNKYINLLTQEIMIINHSSFSSVYDESLSRIMNNKFFKICSWYDNEWGFSNRMLDVAKILARN